MYNSSRITVSEWFRSSSTASKLASIQSGASRIYVTPGAIAESLIQLVGQYDKPILVVGVTIALLALSAWAGALTQRGQSLAVVVFGTLIGSFLGVHGQLEGPAREWFGLQGFEYLDLARLWIPG